MTGKAILAAAAREVGYHEGEGKKNKFGEWFGMNGVAWCIHLPRLRRGPAVQDAELRRAPALVPAQRARVHRQGPSAWLHRDLRLSQDRLRHGPRGALQMSADRCAFLVCILVCKMFLQTWN